MPEWSRKRQANSNRISEACKTISSLRVPQVPGYIQHGYYKYFVFIRPDRLKQEWNRDRIISEINQLKVPCYSGGCPEIYLEKVFENSSWKPRRRYPIAKELGETSLMFLVHPTLTESEIESCLPSSKE